MNSLFFELIRVAIGTQDTLSRPPSRGEWAELYAMAKKQSLVGICFAGLQRLYNEDNQEPSIQNPQPNSTQNQEPRTKNLDEVQYLTWMGMAAKIQQKNEAVNRHCVELQEKLSADGIRSYIMKGQSNAALYGELQHLRQSGDIDVYIEGGLEKVLAYAEKFGGASGVNELEMHVDVFDDTEVEFHYRPFIMRNPWKNRKLQAFFDDCAEGNFSNTLNLSNSSSNSEPLTIVAPTTEFNLVHQLAHIHLHLFTEGIGMRQLMDYYFVLRDFKTKTIKTPEGSASACASGNLSKLNSSATQTTADSNAVALDPSGKKHEKQLSPVEVISDLGLNRFASALMWVIKTVFVGHDNDNEDDNWMLWKPNDEDGRFLLDEIMTSGNFGHHDEKQQERKSKAGYGLWALLIRNLKLSRFDRGDWFWGPLWRVYHFVWRKAKGFN